MSQYQLHRCVWDHIRASEVKSGTSATFDPDRYDLSGEERKAYENKDITELYRLGLHPVLLNAFCRAAGFGRDEYRKLLEPFAEPEERKGRWQR